MNTDLGNMGQGGQQIQVNVKDLEADIKLMLEEL